MCVCERERERERERKRECENVCERDRERERETGKERERERERKKERERDRGRERQTSAQEDELPILRRLLAARDLWCVREGSAFLCAKRPLLDPKFSRWASRSRQGRRPLPATSSRWNKALLSRNQLLSFTHLSLPVSPPAATNPPRKMSCPSSAGFLLPETCAWSGKGQLCSVRFQCWRGGNVVVQGFPYTDVSKFRAIQVSAINNSKP